MSCKEIAIKNIDRDREWAIGKYEKIGKDIGTIVDEKQKQYGDSFHRSQAIIEALYPSGISVSQYPDALYIIRLIDKLFRIVTNNDPTGENPAKDIAGYSILKACGE